MLCRLHPGLEALYIIVGAYGNGSVIEGRALVIFGRDDVDRGAGARDAGREHSLVYVVPKHPSTTEGREGARVDVYDAIGERLDEALGELLHVAGQRDEVALVLTHRRDQGRVRIFVGARADVQVRDVVLARALQRPSLGVVADDQRDLCAQVSAFARVDESLQIRAAAGGHHGDARGLGHGREPINFDHRWGLGSLRGNCDECETATQRSERFSCLGRILPAMSKRASAGANAPDHERPRIRSTTVVCVRRNGVVALGADGQVSIGNTIMKSGATKVRTLAKGRILAGFAGSAADGLTLCDLLEAKLEAVGGNFVRAAVELAKDWRMDRRYRRLEALMIVADAERSLLLSGTGDVIESDDGILAIGSGGNYALSAARALMRHSELEAVELVKESLRVAGEICVFTNDQHQVLSLPAEVAK